MGVHKKAVRKCCRAGCGRVALVNEGVKGTAGRFFCSPACAPLKPGPKSTGPTPDGHEERIQKYMQRVAAGLPLFETPRRRSA